MKLFEKSIGKINDIKAAKAAERLNKASERARKKDNKNYISYVENMQKRLIQSGHTLAESYSITGDLLNKYEETGNKTYISYDEI